jgi:hypothetical protein
MDTYLWGMLAKKVYGQSSPSLCMQIYHAWHEEGVNALRSRVLAKVKALQPRVCMSDIAAVGGHAIIMCNTGTAVSSRVIQVSHETHFVYIQFMLHYFFRVFASCVCMRELCCK